VTAYPAAGHTTLIFVLNQPALLGAQKHKSSLGGQQAQLGHRENEDALIFGKKFSLQ